MPKSKIVDEQEVMDWFDEDRTYQWMVDTYRDKYGIDTTISMWGNFRRRRGLARRVAWDDQLIPWKVHEDHRYAYPILMLRKEARRRAGFPLPAGVDREVDVWLRKMRANGTVLAYIPEIGNGWHYVPRRDGLDHDIIREPEWRA